jgi:hypothetical protein
MGGVLACGMADVENAQGKRHQGANRFYRILYVNLNFLKRRATVVAFHGLM